MLVEALCDTNLPPATHTQKLAEVKTRGRLEVRAIDEATHLSLCRESWPGLNKKIAEFCRSVAVE